MNNAWAYPQDMWQTQEVQAYLGTNSCLFEYVHKALEGFPETDRCPVPPISYTSRLLSERPYVEHNVRPVGLGSVDFVDITGNSKKIKFSLDNPDYPYPRTKSDIIEDYNMLGFPGDMVYGEHFSITLNNKTIYTGILGVLYAVVAYTLNGRIQNTAHVRYVLEYALYNTNSTTLRGINNYYSWISCANLKDVGLQYILEVLYAKITQYQCEFYATKNDTWMILQHISELFR